jgi:hypothetical protein
MQLFDSWISFLILVFCVLWSLISINVVYNIILRAVYIRVQVQETWGSKDWIFKLGEYSLEGGDHQDVAGK